MGPSFDVSSRAASDMIFKIADRAWASAHRAGHLIPKIEFAMDLSACHANGCPLKLNELLEAPEFDFNHDVFGIRRHLDQTTGKLGGCFVPRYAAKQQD